MTHSTAETATPSDLGELALAIVFEDLRAWVSKAELSEAEAKTLVEGALQRFPPERHPDLHAIVAG